MAAAGEYTTHTIYRHEGPELMVCHKMRLNQYGCLWQRIWIETADLCACVSVSKGIVASQIMV